jgi:hypothetical protein
VIISEGMHYYWNDWASKNGRTPGTGLFHRIPIEGKFIKTSPESGNLYSIIEIQNELFEIFHKNIKLKQ